jgi:hypothetical protein
MHLGLVDNRKLQKRQVKWFVRRPDGAILATNGRWYNKVSGIEDIKFYSTLGRMESAMHKRRIYSYHGFAIYSEDTCDCCGNIERGTP